MVTEERPEGLQAWSDLCELVDTVRVALNRQLQAEVGLTLAENLVLCQIAMAPDRRLRMVDIAAHLNIAKSAVTKTVDRLEGRGLLIRQSDPGDRRAVYAVLTEQGIETFAAAQPAYLRSVDQHFAGLLDRAELLNLGRMASDVTRASSPTCSPASPSAPGPGAAPGPARRSVPGSPAHHPRSG